MTREIFFHFLTKISNIVEETRLLRSVEKLQLFQRKYIEIQQYSNRSIIQILRSACYKNMNIINLPHQFLTRVKYILTNTYNRRKMSFDFYSIAQV